MQLGHNINSMAYLFKNHLMRNIHILMQKRRNRNRNEQCLHELFLVSTVYWYFIQQPHFSSSLCRSSLTSGPGWTTPSSCASCGPGSLTMTVPCSCCSTTTQAVKPGPRCSRTWSRPQWNMSWTWASSQSCRVQIPTGDTSSVSGQVCSISKTWH